MLQIVNQVLIAALSSSCNSSVFLPAFVQSSLFSLVDSKNILGFVYLVDSFD